MIKENISKLAYDALNPELNFNVALEYEKIGQTASAISFFLRAAEYGYKNQQLITYTSLIKISNCFKLQGERENTVENALRQAISYLPQRPEAYLFISQYFENKKMYDMSYVFANIGISFINKDLEKLPADIEYFDYALYFEKAVSAWWIGRQAESKIIFADLLQNQKMIDVYRNACIQNLERI